MKSISYNQDIERHTSTWGDTSYMEGYNSESAVLRFVSLAQHQVAVIVQTSVVCIVSGILSCGADNGLLWLLAELDRLNGIGGQTATGFPRCMEPSKSRGSWAKD